MPRQRFSGNAISSPGRLHPGALGMAAPEPGERAIDDLFSATYEELLRLAGYVKRSHGQATLSPATLVNEAFVKLAGSKPMEFQSILHFKWTAARAMRQILVDAARRRGAQKRGGGGDVIFVTFDDMSTPIRCDQELLALHESLDALARLDPHQALLVECRFFGGMDISETARLLDISPATVLRHWRVAKAWLATEMRCQA